MEAGEAAEDEQRRHLTWLVFMRLWTTAGTKPIGTEAESYARARLYAR